MFRNGRKFVNNGSLKYDRESSMFVYDPNKWNYFEILSIVTEMSYVNVKELWYSLGGGSLLEGRLELLSNEKGVCHMVNIVTLSG